MVLSFGYPQMMPGKWSTAALDLEVSLSCSCSSSIYVSHMLIHSFSASGSSELNDQLKLQSVSLPFFHLLPFPWVHSIRRTTKKLCGNRHSLEMHRCIWNCALWPDNNFHRSTTSWVVDGRLDGYIGDIHFALRFSRTLPVFSGLTSTFSYNS